MLKALLNNIFMNDWILHHCARQQFRHARLPPPPLILLAFITGNSTLEPLLEGLFAQRPTVVPIHKRVVYMHGISPTGLDWKWVTTITAVMILNYTVGLDVLVMRSNPIHRVCGRVNCRLTVCHHSFSRCCRTSCQTWVDSLAKTFHSQLQGDLR